MRGFRSKRKIRLKVKMFLRRYMLLNEFCKSCGVTQPLVWYADDGLWDRVSGNANVLCPQCFTERANELGVWLIWRPIRESS